jgi:ABC-type transport system involved in multi-copper enzyme maturation permease subunit
MLILAGLFVLGIFGMSIVGIENPSTANLLLNLGMSLAWFLAHILALLTAARQIPGEMEARTLYPLLARPLERGDYYLGKWMAVTFSGCAVLYLLLLLGWLPVPRLQFYDTRLFLQIVVLLTISIAMLTALTLLFSLLIPRGVNVVFLSLLLIFGGGIMEFFQSPTLHSFGDGARKAGSTFVSQVLRWFTAYIPDFAKLNLITRYTDGIGPLGGMEFLALICYGGLFTVIALLLGIHLFQRRSL